MVSTHETVLAAAFVILAFSPVASAFTPEEEASFFTREGEQSSAVEFDGHYMVIVNGIETAILKKSGEDFLVVQDANAIDSAVDDYSDAAFEELKDIAPQALLDFNDTRTAIDSCIIGSNWFSFNLTRGGVYVKFNVRYDRFHFPKEWGAIWFIYNNTEAFQADWAKVEQGLDVLDTQLNDKEKALAAAKDIRESLPPVKNLYPKFYEAYLNATSSNQFAYRYRGIDRGCAPTSNVTSGIDSLTASIGLNKFNPPSFLKESIKSRTAERSAEARQNKIRTGASSTAGDLSTEADLLAQNFSVYGVNLDKLKTEAQNLRNAVGTSSFENQSQTFSTRLDRYKIIYSQYLAARQAIQEAEQAILNASNRFGPTDGRIADLNNQLQDVKIALREGESALGAGNIEVVDMAGVGQNATQITLAAQTLQPKENELDFVTIGALVLVVLGIAGGAYYFYQKRKPPSSGVTPSKPAPKVSLEDIQKM